MLYNVKHPSVTVPDMAHSAGRTGQLNHLKHTGFNQMTAASPSLPFPSLPQEKEKENNKNKKKWFPGPTSEDLSPGFQQYCFIKAIQEDLEGKRVLFCAHPQTGWEFHNAPRHKHNLRGYWTFLRKTKTIFAKF